MVDTKESKKEQAEANAEVKAETKAEAKPPKKNKAEAASKGGEKGKEGAKDKAKDGAKPKKEFKPRKPSAYKNRYLTECVPALIEKFGYANRMMVPRLEKIIINTSIKEALQDRKVLETASDEIAAIAGQKPVITKAKKSIANFKLRKGQSIGARVTLRKRNMFEFMNRLVNVALPRVRDFKGVSPKGFDGRGNYTLGLTEQTIFPEVNFDKVNRTTGMNITFVTSAKSDEEGKELLSLMGMPFRTQ